MEVKTGIRKYLGVYKEREQW